MDFVLLIIRQIKNVLISFYFILFNILFSVDFTECIIIVQ